MHLVLKWYVACSPQTKDHLAKSNGEFDGGSPTAAQPDFLSEARLCLGAAVKTLIRCTLTGEFSH